MPAPRSRSKRYNSEYQRHYTKFSSKRPNTVKGEVTRSFSAADLRSVGSTPRAGLQSMQLGVVHEPPLQRKRIVPYEKNHNIFATGTVKEVTDRVWLESDDASSVSSYSMKNKQTKSNGHHTKPKTSTNARDTPIMAAERKILGTSSPQRARSYPYISDRIPRESTYTQAFGITGRKSRVKERRRKSASPTRKHREELRRHKSGMTPDKLPAAGIHTATSIGDARLLVPSDNSQYMRSPERQERERIHDSEYRSRFKLVDGTWIESPEQQGRPSPVRAPDKDLGWYKEALSRRSEAYGYAHRERGTHFSRKELDRQNYLQAAANGHDDSFSSVAESVSSTHHSIEKKKEPKKNRKKTRENGHDKPLPPRHEAWADRPNSPVDSEYTHTTIDTETTAEEGPCFLERGRSPTPELRDSGQSRRHHYDVTTNILNDKLQKSLTFAEQSPSKTHKTRQKENQEFRVKDHGRHKAPTPPLSVGNGSDAGSYVHRPNVNRIEKDDDAMSEVSMSSRASVAADTLDRARRRRDQFWDK